MKLKGKQLKRVRRFRTGDPFRRKVARVRHLADKMIKAPVLRGMCVHFDLKKQTTQPLPTTIDIEAWNKDFDTMALCELFGVPYEMYQVSQTSKP